MSDTNPAVDTQVQDAALPNADAPPQPKAQNPQDANTGILGQTGEPTTPTEPKGAEDKGGEPTTPPAPTEIEITVPEGANAELVDAFKSVAKEIELDSAKAQKVVDVFHQAEKKLVEARQNEWREAQSNWLAEVKSDPEFGGAKFDHNVNLANRALEKYGGEELISYLNNAGLANFPPLVRAFMRIGQAMEPDSVAGKLGGAPQGDDNVDPFTKWLRETDPKDSPQRVE